MTALRNTLPKKKTEIIAFSSGKGGTGKTLIATCLGYALTKIGLHVLMIDTDIATDGLSLYLLGPAGVDKVKEFPPSSTFSGILRQYKINGNFQFQPWKINRSLQSDHGVIYEAIISGRQMYGDRFESTGNESNTQLDREAYRHVVQSMFDSLREKAEFDYVIVDTRGGFSDESTDVSALADSYIVVTEADITSFYQNRNLIQYIDTAASQFDKKAILRSIIVNKSTQFNSAADDPDLDHLESSFRLQLEREFPIDYKATHPLPLSLEALTVQKSHKIPIRHALDSDFSYAFLVAFHNILSVVTQPWTNTQVAGWNNLVESVNAAIEKRNEKLQTAEIVEQEQHQELEKLRKESSEYVHRISSLEREVKEIDERYKREIQRSDKLIATKLGSDTKPKQPDPGTKQVTRPRRSLAPAILGLLAIGAIAAFALINPGFFTFASAAPTSSLTFTASASLPTETPAPTATSATMIPVVVEATQIPSTTDTPAPTATIASTAVDCSPIDPRSALSGNVAHFVGDKTILPGTEIVGGQSFEKIWTIQNVGNVTWNTNYTFQVAEAEDFGNYEVHHFSSDVNPGECIDLSINLLAPKAPGTYTGTWALFDDVGKRFSFDEARIVTLGVSIEVK